MYICQNCGLDLCSKEHQSEWVEGKGNICPTCWSKQGMVLDNGKKVFEESQRTKTPIIKNQICLKGNPAYDLMM